MTGIEPPKFNPDSPAWMRVAELREALGLSEPTALDKWRAKVGRQYEHHEKRGEYRGVWIYLPAWLPAWSDARRTAAAPAAVGDAEPTPRQRKEQASARLVELQVAEREREVDANWARKEDVLDTFMGVYAVFNACGERMCGNCKQILADGFSEIDHQHLHRNGSSGGAGKVSSENRVKPS